MTEDEKLRESLVERYRAVLELLESGETDPELVDAELPTNDDELTVLGNSIVSLAERVTIRFQRERQFAELSNEIVQGLYLDEVLEHIFESFKTVIPYDRIGCALLVDGGKVVRARWAKTDLGIPKIKVGYSAPLAGSSLEGIIRSGNQRIINDLGAYQDAHPNSKPTRLALAEGIQSSLTCPLIANGRPVGFLFFSSQFTDTYKSIHQETFTRLADIVSIVVEKSLLYERMADLNEELIDARDQWKRQASHDGLTGLLNRGAILQVLDERVEAVNSPVAKHSGSLAVLMFDIDHFKIVNDTYGHVAGDAVLREVARTLESSLRRTDEIGRYGGEEFLAVVVVSDNEDLHVFADRLRVAVERQLISVDEVEIGVTVSVGATIAVAGQPVDTDELVRRADAALYRAKEAGRNRAAVDGVVELS